MSLRDNAFSAVRWTTAAAACRMLLQLGQLAALTRMLDPADFGLMAMVAAIISISAIVADGSINSAYMQRQSISAEERSSLYWLSVLAGAGACALLCLLSPAIAFMLDNPELPPLIMLASLVFIFQGFGQQLRTHAEKQLDFRGVFVVEIATAVTGFLVAITAARMGKGVYSLVYASLASSCANSALAWLFLARGWRPIWRFQFADVRSFLGFGLALTANNLVSEVSRNFDLLLGGRLLSTSALGLYSLPRNLMFQVQGIVNPIITRVSFPLIAKIQDDIPRVRRAYLQSINLISSTNAPVYLAIAAFAPEVTAILFGEKWGAAAPVLRILAIWGGIRSLGNPMGTLVLGLGYASRSLKWNIAWLFVIPPALMVGAAQGGLHGLAWTLLLIVCLIILLGWQIFLRPLCQVSFLEYMDACFRPFGIAATSLAPAYLLLPEALDPLTRLGCAAILTAPLYLALSYGLNGSWLVAMRELLKFKI